MNRPAFCILLGLASTLLIAADNPLAGFAETKRIESDYEKAVALIEADVSKRMGEAEDARLESYRAILEKIKKNGDLDRAVAIRDRIKEYEAAAEEGRVVTAPNARDAKLKILTAVYGVNQSWIDVTDKLQKMVGKKQSWTMTVKDDDWGDPEPRPELVNTLLVRFSIRGRVGIAASHQGKDIRFP